uniref:Uncharacterized protein n=1 Tax=Arundo donax TaxID=35708 RepID=A0A0A8Y9B3_ARUDO
MMHYCKPPFDSNKNRKHVKVAKHYKKTCMSQATFEFF